MDLLSRFCTGIFSQRKRTRSSQMLACAENSRPGTRGAGNEEGRLFSQATQMYSPETFLS